MRMRCSRRTRNYDSAVFQWATCSSTMTRRNRRPRTMQSQCKVSGGKEIAGGKALAVNISLVISYARYLHGDLALNTQFLMEWCDKRLAFNGPDSDERISVRKKRFLEMSAFDRLTRKAYGTSRRMERRSLIARLVMQRFLTRIEKEMCCIKARRTLLFLA